MESKEKIDKVREFIESGSYFPMTRGEMMTVLGVPGEDKEEFTEILKLLVSEGTIFKKKDLKFLSCRAKGYKKSIFHDSGKGYGFADTDEGEFFLPPTDTMGALDGDEVLIRETKSYRGKSSVAAVIAILKRAHETLVGTFKERGFYGEFIADNRRISCRFLIAPEDFSGALDGQKVVVKILSYPSEKHNPTAAVAEVLGFPTDFGVDVLSIVKGYGFETEFPEDVMREAQALPSEVTDISGRLDLTDEIIFTIDGADTKDIDDAVSIEKNGDIYRLGVHIADVSHYVKPYSALDENALSRGTSVYLADRVIPMLPPKLSNGICSLNEGVLRYAVSVFTDIDASGKVLSHKIYESVIRSSAKMTYDDVYLLMTDSAPEELCSRYEKITPSIKTMYELYKILHAASVERGSVNFETPEARIVLNDDGEAVDIVLRERNDAHKLIEEFMVITNSVVAEHLTARSLPAVFRTHDAPDGEKLDSFRSFVQSLGCNPPEGRFSPKKLQEFLDSLKDEKSYSVISAAALRSMQKAKYSDTNLGHYALALAFYAHFTSPIRRYPDLVVHRALKASLEGDKKTLDYVKKTAKRAAEMSSSREIAAERAERDTDDIKKAQYMSHRVGENFAGIISSVTRFGLFIELPNTVEGLIGIESIPGRAEFDEKKLTLSTSGHVYHIGDEVAVTLAAVDVSRGYIDFVLEGTDCGKKKPKADSAKQEGAPRVHHRRKHRGGHRAVRHRGKKRPSGESKS